MLKYIRDGPPIPRTLNGFFKMIIGMKFTRNEFCNLIRCLKTSRKRSAFVKLSIGDEQAVQRTLHFWEWKQDKQKKIESTKAWHYATRHEIPFLLPRLLQERQRFAYQNANICRFGRSWCALLVPAEIGRARTQIILNFYFCNVMTDPCDNHLFSAVKFKNPINGTTRVMF